MLAFHRFVDKKRKFRWNLRETNGDYDEILTTGALEYGAAEARDSELIRIIDAVRTGNFEVVDDDTRRLKKRRER